MTHKLSVQGERALLDERRIALAQLVQDESPAIKALVSSVVRRACPDRPVAQQLQMADDLYSEVLVRALSEAESYDPGRSLMGWLVGIARNVLRGELRRQAAGARPVSRGRVDDALWERLKGIVPSASGEFIDSQLERILSLLPPISRQALEVITCKVSMATTWLALWGQVVARLGLAFIEPCTRSAII